MSEQLMSAEKYSWIVLRQMETFVYLFKIVLTDNSFYYVTIEISRSLLKQFQSQWI